MKVCKQLLTRRLASILLAQAGLIPNDFGDTTPFSDFKKLGTVVNSTKWIEINANERLESEKDEQV